MRIGIMGALPEEIDAIVQTLERAETDTRGGRTFYRGHLHGHEVTCVHARIGKVAGAITAAELVIRREVELVLFTGLAGALAPDLEPGDLVVADTLAHHDLDARPLFPALEIPLTGRSHLPTTPEIADTLFEAAAQHARQEADAGVRRGVIVSGDQFIRTAEARARILSLVPEALCAEMEGAAVAQVCTDYNVPFGVVRLISDRADGHAAASFTDSLASRAADASARVVSGTLSRI